MQGFHRHVPDVLPMITLNHNGEHSFVSEKHLPLLLLQGLTSPSAAPRVGARYCTSRMRQRSNNAPRGI